MRAIVSRVIPRPFSPIFPFSTLERRKRNMNRVGDRHCRCSCGNLLARLTEHGVEIKCKRCKRLVLVRWERGDAREA